MGRIASPLLSFATRRVATLLIATLPIACDPKSGSVAPSPRKPASSEVVSEKKRIFGVLSRSEREGVPLHESAAPHSPFRRVNNGTRAELLSPRDAEGPLLVRTEEGVQGYVSRRYFSDQSVSGATPRESSTVKTVEAFSPAAHSLAECQSQLRWATKTQESPLVIGSFNVRWFPDGEPGERSKHPTDIPWLACTIAMMGADVLALQEWKQTVRATAATKDLLTELERLTNQKWEISLDACPDRGAQHVGLLWNSARVTLDGLRTVPEFNPHGAACEGRLRPGLMGIVRLVGSENAKTLALISVHLKSGADSRSYGLREETWKKVLPWLRALGGAAVIAGDLNTMGCEDCATPVSASAERLQRDASLASMGAELVPDAPECSHFYSGKPGLLDGFVVLGRKARTTYAGGSCALSGCRVHSRGSEFEAQVSDHCPLSLVLDALP